METKRHFYLLTSLFALVIGFSSFSQKMESITPEVFVREMQPVVAKMNRDNSTIRFKREVYKDLKTKELVSTSSGCLYHGAGMTFRLENDQVTIIQDNSLYLIIDSTAGIIQLSEADTTFNPAGAIANFNTASLEKFQLFRSHSGTFDQYKIIPEDLSEGTIEYFVDTKTQQIYKVSITYPPANYFSENMDDETLEEPFAIVIYEPLKQLVSEGKLFDMSTILLPLGDGRFKLTEAYRDFELYDARYEPAN